MTKGEWGAGLVTSLFAYLIYIVYDVLKAYMHSYNFWSGESVFQHNRTGISSTLLSNAFCHLLDDDPVYKYGDSDYSCEYSSKSGCSC